MLTGTPLVFLTVSPPMIQKAQLPHFYFFSCPIREQVKTNTVKKVGRYFQI